MSLKIYTCSECELEFAMRDDTVEENEELTCPACGEPVDDDTGAEGDEEEDPGHTQESNTRGRRNPRRPNPLLRRRR